MSDKGNKKAGDMYDSQVVDIRRTTSVREGGRDFSFSALAVVGDRQGQIGFGRGKAKEVVSAAQKATDAARRNMHKIALRGNTVQYPMIGRYGAAKVIIKPGAEGTGIIAGGAMRPIFEVLGVKNVVAKCIGSANPTTVVRATIDALIAMESPASIAEKRGKTVKDILGKRKDDEVSE